MRRDTVPENEQRTEKGATMSHYPTCEERVDGRLRRRINQMRHIFDIHTRVKEPDDEYGEDSLYEFGLCFVYIPLNTYHDQPEAYWLYQLSTGGPGDELRFFASGPNYEPYRIEYWFLDWYDGAHRVVSGDDREVLLEYWWRFVESETTRYTQEDAVRDQEGA